jgi:cell division protein FtsI (penicillin-binding protein 3)
MRGARRPGDDRSARGAGDRAARAGGPPRAPRNQPPRATPRNAPRTTPNSAPRTTARPGPVRNGRPPHPPRRPIVRRVLRARADPGRRLGITLLAIAVVMSLFAGRLVQLQGFQSSTYKRLAQDQRLQTQTLPAVRGTITAANGQVLAMTVQTYLVYADPKEITAAQMPQVAAAVAAPLGLDSAAVLSLLQHPTSPQYVVLKKGVSQQIANQVKRLGLPGDPDAAQISGETYGSITFSGLPGISMSASYARSYPDGNSTSNLLGATSTTASGGLDGVAGLELSDNSLLAGKPGQEQYQQSINGEQIPLAADKNTPAVNGSGLQLTIVPALQWEAQEACWQQVQKANADSCTVVIEQPKTGKILAMAQWPAYSADGGPGTTSENLAVQDVFEPGSTAKVITASAAMEKGGQSITSTYTVPDQIVEGGYSFRDAEDHPTERWTIAGILANSSNDGMVQVVGHVPPQTQYDYLRAFGLGSVTGLDLPGETKGILPAPSAWWGNERYTLSFGQGVDADAVQMASVYSTIANGGVRVQPTLVQGTTSSAGKYQPAAASSSRRVIQASTAKALIGALQQVPAVDEEANEPWGIIPGYAIAAKTGTSQEWDATKKCLCKYGASYIGMAPGDNPQIVVAVNVQNPKKGGYFGDVVAGPVFYKVMEFALQTMKIPPDGAKPADVPLTGP